RHTRFSRDWSSDVCSSDLEAGNPVEPPRGVPDVPRSPAMSNLIEIRERAAEVAKELRELRETPEAKRGDTFATDVRNKTAELNRSEERRAGTGWGVRTWDR